jgi:cell division protein FtsQ
MNALVRIAAWLLAITLVTLPVVAVLNGWIAGSRWPMRHLVVTGEFRQVSDAKVRQIVLPYVQRGFFAVDLESMRTRLAALPWVQKVEVRKRWPDRLEVSLSEYRPLARWGKDRLLSENGEIFPAPAVPLPTLPQFDAPDDRAADMIAFHNLARPLFLGIGRQVTAATLSARGSWSLRLSDGTEIDIGRGEPEAHLARFARLMPRLLSAEHRPLLRADLRYTNGFALTWGAKPAPQSSPHPNPPPQSGGGSTAPQVQANT